MKKIRADVAIRRFMDGLTIRDLAALCGDMSYENARDYVEQCIRRGLRGEVKVMHGKRRST